MLCSEDHRSCSFSNCLNRTTILPAVSAVARLSPSATTYKTMLNFQGSAHIFDLAVNLLYLTRDIDEDQNF